MIPDSFIQDLLARVDIVDLVDSYVPLKKAGANYAACCPFHNEKSPSFTVSPTKQFYHCFGCGKNGNAIGFLMDYEHLAFPEAVEELARSAGIEVPREGGGAAAGQQDQYAEILHWLARADQWFRQQLRHHPERARPIEYLRGRGLAEGIGRVDDRIERALLDLVDDLLEHPAHALGLVPQVAEVDTERAAVLVEHVEGAQTRHAQQPAQDRQQPPLVFGREARRAEHEQAPERTQAAVALGPRRAADGVEHAEVFEHPGATKVVSSPCASQGRIPLVVRVDWAVRLSSSRRGRRLRGLPLVEAIRRSRLAEPLAPASSASSAGRAAGRSRPERPRPRDTGGWRRPCPLLRAASAP